MNKTHVIKPLIDDDYPVISYGKGIYLYDQDGKRYIDASSGQLQQVSDTA